MHLYLTFENLVSKINVNKSKILIVPIKCLKMIFKEKCLKIKQNELVLNSFRIHQTISLDILINATIRLYWKNINALGKKLRS
jgi:hypothetical protein